MMPLPPERSTMCVPAKPKADFSIDFIVGNNNNTKSASQLGKGPSSPVGGRQPTPPYSRTSTSPPREPQDEDDDVRARLLGMQAGMQAEALHGLLQHPLCASGAALTPSPPHSPPGLPPPPPFLLRGLYRPEPLLAPPQLPPHLPPHLLHAQHPGALAGPMAPKDSYPLYPWLLARHGRMFPHRFPGVGGPDFAGFLLHPFRKPKRIRTAFSPSQLLKLEHAFENNHYVVGAERKQVAQALGLSETQVKVWFQNRRTKHKRTEQEEEAKRKANNNNKQGEDSSLSSGSNNSSSSGQQAEVDERSSPPLPHRPVDLSSHDDSSDMESES